MQRCRAPLRVTLFRWLVCAVLMPALAGAITCGQERTIPAAKTQGGPTEVDRKILASAKTGSEVMANLTYLSDTIGPRVTGSAALKKANDWTAAKMKSYGLTSVHLEPYSIPEGWERGPVHARLVEPDNGRSLSMASVAWTPGTRGKVQGDVAIVQAKSIAELAPYRGKLKNTIVLLGPPAKLRPLAEMDKPRAGPPSGSGFGPRGQGDGGPDRRFFEERRALQRALASFLHKEGVAASLRDAGKHFGLLSTGGGWRGQDRPSAGNRIPSLTVAHNHYELLYRLASRPSPARTRLELEVSNTFIPGPLRVFNTVGEIRGRDRPDEVVVCAAHLDSWDLGQGTTDNGTGSCVVLEAARILARCGTAPRRTIRFILFSGEEQGLHGSRAYVQQHKDELKRFSAALVHDTGTGRVIGLGLGGRPGAQKVLAADLAWLKELGVTEFTRRSMGGSDHMSFDSAGVPGFMFRQEIAGYGFTHHSQADTLDRASAANLEQSATVMAVVAMHVANMEKLLPRDKAPGRGAGRTGANSFGIGAQELRSLLEKIRARHNVPALAASIVRVDNGARLAVVGVRKRGTDIPATADDQWHLGSNTKPMTALLVALLIDSGVLNWDTPLEQIFPEHAGKWGADLRKITPAHLLTHTSGLPAMGPLVWFLIGSHQGSPLQHRERLVKSLGTVKLTAKPGEKYEYSNLGYVVLGAIIDRRGKASWEDQLEKKVFQPLGIKHWGLGPVGSKEAVVQPWPHQTGGDPVPADGTMDNPPIVNSAGRVHMSVPDYNRFLTETLKLARGEKGLLKPATARKLFTNPYPASPHSLSGWVGFRKQPADRGLVLRHDGSNTFNYCTAAVVPDQGLAFCVLTNQGSPGGPGAKACLEVVKELQGPEKR
jgi:CubicO group peptidase (beta-lactamase class C family)